MTNQQLERRTNIMSIITMITAIASLVGMGFAMGQFYFDHDKKF